MAEDEFSLIHKYFVAHNPALSAAANRGVTPGSNPGLDLGSDIVIGIGDDCSLLRTHAGEHLAVTTDTLIEGVHFPSNSRAEDIAQRALRVNLSDIAAMGAEPRWFQLALTLPQADDDWLQEFSSGLFAAAEQYACALVGGDTTRGPLVVSITLIGALPIGSALTRDGASVGDKIFVTGELGAGIAGLYLIEHPSLESPDRDQLTLAFWRPQPRLTEAMSLRDVASAAVDISDGLVADLGHIAAASGLGAKIYEAQIPLSQEALAEFGEQQVREWALCGGDDYELCFTVAPEKLDELSLLRKEGLVQATEIGELVPDAGVKCLDKEGNTVTLGQSGYSHF